MKTIEKVPKLHKMHIIPNKMIENCRYTCGKMRVNGAPMILGLVSQVFKM